MIRWGRCVLVVLLLFTFGRGALAQGVIKDLLPPIPEDANALVMIHAKGLRESDFGRDFERKTYRGVSNVDKHIIPRKDIQRMVFAAELNPAGLMPIWEVAVIETASDITLQSLSSRAAGTMEALGDLSAILLPHDAYLIKLKSNWIGTFGPANRQRAARWAQRAVSAKEARLSPYLSKIAEFPETAGTEVMLALDLTGMTQREELRAKLDQLETLQTRPRIDRDQLARVLNSVRGVALGVKATDTLNGKLRVDFELNPAMMKEFAKPLLLEVIGRQGLMIEELAGWEASIEGNTVFLGGTLTAGGLRRVLSLIDPPSLSEREHVMSPGEQANPATASLNYFHEVKKLLDDMDDPQNKKYLQSSGWYDRYARKFEQLPVLNVDPELVEYGSSMAAAFRAFAYKGRAGYAEAATQSSNLNRPVTVAPAGSEMVGVVGGWYGGYSSVYNTYNYYVGPHQGLSDRQKAERQVRSYMAMSLGELRQAVANSTNDIRVKMTQKYQVEF